MGPIVNTKVPPEDYERMRKVHRALVLHYVEGLSQAEIAKRMGASNSTVNRLIKASRRVESAAAAEAQA